MLENIQGYVEAYEIMELHKRGESVLADEQLISGFADLVRLSSDVPSAELSLELYSAFKSLWRYDPEFIKFPFPLDGDFEQPGSPVVYIKDRDLSQHVKDSLVVLLYMRFGYKLSRL